VLAQDGTAERRASKEAAAAYALDVLASATCRAYRCDYRRFETWCHRHSLTVTPDEPETVTAFLALEAAALRQHDRLGKRPTSGSVGRTSARRQGSRPGLLVTS
jgi:hypothetical protein